MRPDQDQGLGQNHENLDKLTISQAETKRVSIAGVEHLEFGQWWST